MLERATNSLSRLLVRGVLTCSMRRIRVVIGVVATCWLLLVAAWLSVYHGKHDSDDDSDESDQPAAASALTSTFPLSSPQQHRENADTLSPTAVPRSSTSTSTSAPINERQPVASSNDADYCAVTRESAALIADDRGQVCTREQLSSGDGIASSTNCCPYASDAIEQCMSVSAQRCNGQCCVAYEYCVSCCVLLAMRPPIARSAQRSRFVQCTRQCRTSSRSLNAHGRYTSAFKHCFTLDRHADAVATPTLLPLAHNATAAATRSPEPNTQDVQFVEF